MLNGTRRFKVAKSIQKSLYSRFPFAIASEAARDVCESFIVCVCVCVNGLRWCAHSVFEIRFGYSQHLRQPDFNALCNAIVFQLFGNCWRNRSTILAFV